MKKPLFFLFAKNPVKSVSYSRQTPEEITKGMKDAGMKGLRGKSYSQLNLQSSQVDDALWALGARRIAGKWCL